VDFAIIKKIAKSFLYVGKYEPQKENTNYWYKNIKIQVEIFVNRK